MVASKCFLNDESILGGKGKIYTTPQSNGNYYVRAWIPEQKYTLRQSLRTKNHKQALKLAEKVLFDIYAKVHRGESLVGLIWNELCDLFLQRQAERHSFGHITKQRLDVLRTQVNRHIKSLVKNGKLTKLNDIEPRDFIPYAHNRRIQAKSESKRKTVEEVTIRNEYTTIGAIVKFGFQERHINYSHILKEEIHIKGDQISRRETFDSFNEYMKFVGGLKHFVKKAKTEKEKYYRQILRDFILICAHSFTRFGELQKLKWRMVDVSKSEYKENWGDNIKKLTITLDAEICKNRRKRVVICKGGQYIERLKTYTYFHDAEDFVFNRFGNREFLSKSQFHRLWHQYLNESGFDEPTFGKKLSYYSLRHWGITGRLLAKMNHYDVAKLAGTSVKYIEQHYEHMDVDKLEKDALKSPKAVRGNFMFSDN
jgi:integrase